MALINSYVIAKDMCLKINTELAAADSWWRIGISRYFDPAGDDETG